LKLHLSTPLANGLQFNWSFVCTRLTPPDVEAAFLKQTFIDPAIGKQTKKK